MEPFLPKCEGDYFSWPSLTELFPWQHSGAQFKRTWPIGETKELLEQRWRVLLGAPATERGALMRETSARRADASHASFLADHPRLPPIAELSRDSSACAPTSSVRIPQ